MVSITRLTPAVLKQQATEARERVRVGQNRSRILRDITVLKGKFGNLPVAYEIISNWSKLFQIENTQQTE
jgi:hypothetical protein